MHLSTRLDILAFGQFDFMKMEKVVLIISTLIAFILSAHAENPEPRQIGCPEEDLKFGDMGCNSIDILLGPESGPVL